ncbi:DUF4142 domain-containing protein [Sphingomonas aracearum]|uniref:DUF4142 domain-containing protein n=1 Tax=Sphingomonas aracearum TaxID=2283317 RepID=A0A369W0N4_9SPHN|nr:DUF4142 domain-containing protein [Sphingomonas aracearum]RDE06920.1 DUF4142 domain-containing protein [Sphingomonas aracearum]
MKNLLILATAASALALGACGRSEAPNTTAANTSAANEMETGNATAMGAETPAVTPGQAFANSAAASDAFEIESSKMALASSSSAAVKSFAQKMIDAHTDSTAKLKSTTASLSPAITPVPALNAEQQKLIDGLKGKTGADFDRAYLAAQATGHAETLELLKAYAASGDVPALKTFASGLVPIVTAHLNMAKGIKA